MDIGRAIQYVFQDPNWIKKILIGGLLFFIPIIGWFIVGGYYLRVVRNVSLGTDSPLPEWDQWGDDFVRGFKIFVTYLVYSIPLILLLCLMGIVASFDDAAGGGAGLLFQCISFIYSIALYFIAPLFIGRLAASENLGDAFQIGDIISEAQRIPSQLLIYVIIVYVAGFVAMFGLILCFVGVVFTSFIANLVTGHLVGQIRGMIAGPPAQEPSV